MAERILIIEDEVKITDFLRRGLSKVPLEVPCKRPAKLRFKPTDVSF